MNANEISSGNNEWYTPSKYIESARKVMGNISLDPAGNELAQKTVMATRYHSKEQNGLDQEWHGNVWLNPPYERGLIDDFIPKLVNSDINQAICLVNASTETNWFQRLLREANYALFTNHRISFINSDGVIKKRNARGQVFFYFGRNSEAFMLEFSKYGFCVKL